MSAARERLDVTVREGGLVSVVIPSDPAVVAARTAALESYWQERAEDDARRIEATPHRSATAPGQLARAERRQQDLSLGWPPDDGRRNLHPISGGFYLMALIGSITELRPRLAAMQAEIAARPEQYGGRLFDLDLWQQCGPEAGPGVVALVAWIAWVARPDSDAGRAARLEVLDGLTLWSNATRLAFGTWCQFPYFPDI